MDNSRICSISDCANPVRARTWCHRHYRRWKRHGDPQGGGTARGEPLNFFASVLAARSPHCVFWPYGRDSSGYGRVYINGRNEAVHRQMCIAAHGDPPTNDHEAAHTCGHGSMGCFTPNHLKWATRTENESDKLIHGTHNRGERHPLVLLTEDQARQIKYGEGSRLEIAKRFGVKKDTVRAIRVGRIWKHV